MALGRFSAGEIAALGQAMLGRAGDQGHLVGFLQRETEGNAFFVVEVVRALAEEAGRLDRIAAMALPARVFAGGIRQAVERRLSRVPQRFQPALALAAVAGRQIDPAALPVAFALAGRERITRRADVDYEQWLTACATAAVLEGQDGRWHFAHDKLREGLLERLSAGRRRRYHRLAGQAIEQAHTAELTPYYGELAHHFGAAGDGERERRYLELAGRAAQCSSSSAGLTRPAAILPKRWSWRPWPKMRAPALAASTPSAAWPASRAATTRP
jgi:hypothetical protein